MQFICSRETKIIVLTKLPKVPDVAEQSRPPTQVEAPAPWSNKIVTMVREKNDDDNDDHCDLEYLRIIKEVHVDEYENDG